MRIIAAGIKGELNILHIYMMTSDYCTTLGNLELVGALQGRGGTTSVNAKEVSRVQAMTDIAIQSTTAWMATEGAARPMPFV